MSEQRDDEFSFLPGDAARVGATGPLPEVRRVRVETAEGRGISGLVFTPNAQGSEASAPPAVAALHGAGLNAHSFDPILLALGTPAVALDLPGHGRSDWRDDADYRPDRLAPDIGAALSRLAPRPLTLIGHSLGGLTAALVAARQPELVSALIVVDITPGISPSRDAGSVAEFITGKRDYASVDEIVDRAVAFGIGSDRAALARGVALNTRRRADGRLEWTHHFAHLDALPSGSNGSKGESSNGSEGGSIHGRGGGNESKRRDDGSEGGESLPYAPIWEVLGEVQRRGTPLALVRASHGMLSDAHVAEWRTRLPDSPVHEIAGSHNLHESAPVALAAVVREVMAQAGCA